MLYLVVVGGTHTPATLNLAPQETSTSLSAPILRTLFSSTRLLQLTEHILRDVTAADFASSGTIFQIGVAPLRVDIINRIDGLTFDEAWAEAETSLCDDAIPIRYISFNHLIANKLAAGRPQDLVAVANLRKAAGTKKT